MMTQTTIRHAIKQELNETLSISIPLITSQLIYASSSFIGTAMVAKLGEDALAASVLVSMIWLSMSVLFFGILNSVSVLVSHQYGAKNDQAISRVMGQSLILGLILCIIMLLMLFTMPYFLKWSDQPARVLQLAREYMFSLLWTVPSLLLLIILEQFLAGIHRAKIVLRISLLIVPIEIPLIYCLVFGKLGLPACGVAGVGYGFATTYFITSVSLVYYLYRSPQYKRFNIFQKIGSFDKSVLKELLAVGLPIGFMHVIEVSTFTFATFWISQFGTTMLAAHQIVMQYLSFTITIVFAMSQAVTVRVGHSVGQKNLQAVYYASYVGMFMNLLCVAIIALAFYIIPTFFLQLDMNVLLPKNAELVRDSSALLSMCAILILFDNCRIIGFGALRGLKDTQFPMYASLISFWLIGLPAAYYFGFITLSGGKGIWWGLTLGIACGALIVLTRMNILLKRVDLNKIMSESVVSH